MPGLHLFCRSNGRSDKEISNTKEVLLWKDSLKIRELHYDGSFELIFSGYDGYPLLTASDDGMIWAVEGMIYNRSDSEIGDFFKGVSINAEAGENIEGVIKSFIDNSDGEFLAVIFLKKTRKLLLFNDRWARLPAYYAITDDGLVFSRELKYVLKHLQSIKLNRLWMAEFLIFEYNLGNKTIIEGVRYLEPAELISVSFHQARLKYESKNLGSDNFDDREELTDRREIIGRCAELFREMVRVRFDRVTAQDYGLIVDVSGGHDTRAVFAGLAGLGAKLTACNDHLTEGIEAEIANSLAEHYHTPLMHFSGLRPNREIDSLADVTFKTDCQVNCLMAVNNYYDEMERETKISGKKVHFMGLGGEFLRHRYRPLRHYRGLNDMIAGDGFSNLFMINQACSVLEMERSVFDKSIVSEIDSWTEKSLRGRVVHLQFERYNKFDNGGENRHRLFNWVVSPFWGKDLFEFIMTRVPLAMIDYFFFVDFLRELDPRSIELPIYSGIAGVNPIRHNYLFRIRAKSKLWLRYNRYLYKSARSFRNRLIGRRKDDPEMIWLRENIGQIMRQSEAVSRYFDIKAVNNLMADYPGSLPLYQLLTIMLYIMDIERRFPGKLS
nr:hypothetical protein [candidate division Zixibacteria bacterium]